MAKNTRLASGLRKSRKTAHGWILIIGVALGTPGLAHRAATDLSELDLSSLQSLTVGSNEELIGGAPGSLPEVSKTSVSMRLSYFEFNDYIKGRDKVAISEALEDYAIAAQNVEYSRAILSLGHRITDRLTWQLQVPLISQVGEGITKDGRRDMSDRRSGFGDMGTAIAYVPWRETGKEVLLRLGVRVPTAETTGKIEVLEQPIRAPYSAQFGEGTVGLQPGLRLARHFAKTEFWLVADADLRLGRNRHGYALGDEYRTWLRLQCDLTESIEWDGVISLSHREKMSGQSEGFPVNLSHYNDPNNSGGEMVSASMGLRWKHNSCPYGGKFIEVRGRIPLYMDLEGLQLSEASQFQVGVGYSF